MSAPSSKMTVSDVSSALLRFASSPAYFKAELSQVMDRYYREGLFKDLVAKVVIPEGTTTGFITLKPEYESLEGIACEHGAPLPIYGQFREWKEMSIGYVAPNEMTQVGVIDMGDGYVTTADIATEGTLRFQILNASDAGKTVRINGRGTVNGTDDVRVYDSTGLLGINLTTVSPTADTTQTFSEVTDIQLPENMLGRSRLYVVNSGTATLLAEYEPGETRPCYRRYKIGVVEDQNIMAFCKLRFLPYRANTDWVRPANLGAIKAGFQALTRENAQQYNGDQGASAMWAYGIRLMNQQLKSFRGGAKPRVNFTGKELLSGPSQVN